MTQAHNFSGKPYVFWDGRANANNKNIQTRDKRPIMIGQNRISSHIYDIFHFSLRQKQPLDQADINENLPNVLKNCARTPSFEKSLFREKKNLSGPLFHT